MMICQNSALAIYAKAVAKIIKITLDYGDIKRTVSIPLIALKILQKKRKLKH
jgi:hypothetical protein